MPTNVNYGSIECIIEFPYLRSLIAVYSRMDVEIDK